MPKKRAEQDRCAGCNIPVPDWPRGWLFTDDGVSLCPACRGNVTLLRKPR